MSRVALESLPSLTFYQDSLTLARRTEAVPQLVCVGKACDLYEPEVVRCVNVGGSGVDIDWKCEADLPSSLRFGRVEVSCEGWSGPGDPYVLRGSCSLEYRLNQVHNSLWDDHSSWWKWWDSVDIFGWIFMIVWGAVLLVIAYSIVMSCLRRSPSSSSNSQSSSRPFRPSEGPGAFPGSSGFFGAGSSDPPPPYSKTSPDSPSAWGWRPGFWSGLTLGGLGAHFLNRRRHDPYVRPTVPPMYDWERERSPFMSSSFRSRPRPRPASAFEDRGEGPSNLGSVRRSTGLGSTKVR